MITLIRYYTPLGTFGKLSLDDFSCVTLERPWENNQENISCIPEGVYTLKLRESAKVNQITHGRYTEGWEITNVPDRDYVMLHPGNYVRNSEACLLCGKEMTVKEGEGLMITNSQETFEKLMTKLSEKSEWQLDIRGYRVEWP